MDDKLKRLKSQPNPLRSVGTSQSGNPLFRGNGIVFGGRDLYGDTFARPRQALVGDDPELKIGTEYFLSEIAEDYDPETGEIRNALWEPVHWDHGLGNLGGKRLGRAAPVKVTQEGIEYLIEIELERAKDYQAMIEFFQNEGWLGLSTQTLPSFASFDWGTGEIKSWYPAELTLTVTPAEYRTREGLEEVRSLFRKYNIEVEAMTKKNTEGIPEEDVLEEEDVEKADDVVDGLLNDLVTQIDEEEDMVLENQALAFVMRSMQDFQETVMNRLDAMDERIAKMASSEDIEDLNTQFVEALRKGFTGLGDVLSRAVRNRAAEYVQQSSDLEISALRNLGQPGGVGETRVSRSVYGLPPNAPGQS